VEQIPRIHIETSSLTSVTLKDNRSVSRNVVWC